MPKLGMDGREASEDRLTGGRLILTFEFVSMANSTHAVEKEQSITDHIREKLSARWSLIMDKLRKLEGV